ncbi:carbohydrate ABC transporter permease [Paenibacillus sp. N3.4]|uniref:carbohydrate ABC transporter permease n=1 Tax=Paenibacillus sp. N3.4 TaxID=2603222 RepID=UPI001C9C019B|nr:carbohydrate ABC transporter permease [Paenibacillus sp. N3.4]
MGGSIQVFINSVAITAISVIGVVFLSTLTGYGFVRLYFYGKELLYASLFILMLIPDILLLAPTFILVKKLQLLDSWGALIFPYVAGGQIIGIFIMRNYIENLPKEIFEAVRMDGASEFQTFGSIIIPLTKPMMMTIAILTSVSVWNDYVWPMTTITNDQLRTVTIGLQFFTTQYEVKTGYLMAANVICSIPILILFMFGTRYFVQGVMSGAVKG